MERSCKLVVGWLILSTIVCAWDAGFVLLRPHSMADGDLEHLWLPYRLYIEIDTRYGDMTDEFVVAQSWANLFEGMLNIAAVILLYDRRFLGILIAYAVSIMTLWKTVIYFLCSTSFVVGHDAFSHVPMTQYVLLFLVPNGVWIGVPLMIVLYYSVKIYKNSKKYKTI